MNRFDLALPGPLDRRTGGTIYDRRIVEGLRALGWDVAVHEMAGTYPLADHAARDAAAAVRAAARGAPLVVDGLALPAFGLDRGAAAEGMIALVHHPLAEETGLAPDLADRLRAGERAALARVAGIIVTSAFTRRTLCDAYGVSADRVVAVAPGVDPIPGPRPARAPGPVRLLSVAALVPRKGHLLLVDALAGMADLDWQLTCIGATDRDPALTAELAARVAAAGLAGRIGFAGEVDEAALAGARLQADLFVHPALYEGYGMALSEALRAGLPIVAAAGGAVADTVPAAAGLLVPPGDGPALAAALRRAIGDAALRGRLAAGAAAAGAALPDWPTAARQFAAAVARLAR
ncbi:glycosyl transferase [Allostella sp. ATCC 35155]|nr:glycosyl transferase [Stella sp. ATCC 35155]